MKVGEVSPVNSKTSVTPVAIPYRTGDVVVVQMQTVLDSTGEVNLKFPGGETLTAVFKNGISFNEGDFVSIKVLGNSENKIYAEIIENNNNLTISKNNITFLLSKINVANSKENYLIAMQMLRGGIKLTKENMEMIKSHINRLPDFSLEKIIFMHKNGLPLSKQYEAILDDMIKHESFFGGKLLALVGEILAGNNKKNRLKKLLNSFFNNPSSPDFSPENLSNKNTISNLVRILSYIQSNYAGHENINEKLGAYIENLQIRNEIAKKLQYLSAYLQIPVNINGNYDVAEFYASVPQEKFKKSVFLRIPTSNLGILGFFIIADHEHNIELHISAEEVSYMTHIKKSIIRLYELLGDVGYKLIKVTYNKIPSDINLYNFSKYSKLLGEKIKFDERM